MKMLTQVDRNMDEKNVPKTEEHHERYMQALETADARLDAECKLEGKQLSGPDREAANEKYFRVEAAKLGMTESEMEGRLYVDAESQRLLKNIMSQSVVQSQLGESAGNEP